VNVNEAAPQMQESNAMKIIKAAAKAPTIALSHKTPKFANKREARLVLIWIAGACSWCKQQRSQIDFHLTSSQLRAHIGHE